MNAKELIENIFFDSIEELKALYPEEVYNMDVAFAEDYPESNVSGMCLIRVDYQKLEIFSTLVTYPEAYHREKYSSDETFWSAVMNTACHEMAHHLDTTRAIKKIRDTWRHQPKKAARELRKYMKQRDPHGETWQTIMNEMQAVY